MRRRAIPELTLEIHERHACHSTLWGEHVSISAPGIQGHSAISYARVRFRLARDAYVATFTSSVADRETTGADGGWTMQGYATEPGSGLFSISPMHGETRSILGIACEWRPVGNCEDGLYIGNVGRITVSGCETLSGAYVCVAVGLLGYDADAVSVVGRGSTLEDAEGDARLRLLGEVVRAAIERDAIAPAVDLRTALRASIGDAHRIARGSSDAVLVAYGEAFVARREREGRGTVPAPMAAVAL